MEGTSIVVLKTSANEPCENASHLQTLGRGHTATNTE